MFNSVAMNSGNRLRTLICRMQRIPTQLVTVRTLTGTNTVIDRGGCRVTVDFDHGLPYDALHDFDHKGHVYLWKVFKMSQSILYRHCFVKSDISGFQELMGDGKFSDFIGAQDGSVGRKFYRAVKEETPVTVQMWLSHLGTSSIGHRIEFREKVSGDVLAAFGDQAVLVSTETRKSAPLPDSYKRKYAGFVVGPRPIVMKRLLRAGETYKCESVVRQTDVNFNGHAAYTLYWRLCSDCASSAVFDGCFKALTDDFSLYKVEQLSCLYLAETQPNDRLLVEAWESDDCEGEVHFAISRKHDDGPAQEIFQATVKFYRGHDDASYLPGSR